MTHITRTLLALTLLYGGSVQASQSPLGWKWYNEPVVKPASKKTPPKPIPPNQTTRVMSATEQMDWFHQTYKEALNDATINSKDEGKLKTVMQLNQFIGERTSETGMTFKKVLHANPELSYLKDRPAEFAARGTYHQLEREKKVAALAHMREAGWGFFFVYDGQDALSQQLAPSMQSFADTHGIEILGLSRDHTFVSGIRENRVNDNKVEVPFSPALILVNPNTGEMKPLAYGFISQTALLGRFYNVANDYQTPDF
ncbi:type-F conjugative transfer system pilin assembly protein TraF [Vibrio sp. 070316B]|uniref:type-F conjugative transfer system pilin assembly protein TraF n=1 Tax=Vibrio TaxID=662 RepID=UPI001493946B|nr:MULTISPECIES: type-F conjugative transfer system pilin assembly protein TraF [unclassified Vibrio]NOI41078.1 type-F conjugative transfer system pilin assembly protein TraF [Vibrio sp. 070316B]